ncbi:hypothetical protein J6590_005568 [Homalodisca vitripennis]|nr:hypothetical protein J6590_005568 [Homalodisca vitripennis]
MRPAGITESNCYQRRRWIAPATVLLPLRSAARHSRRRHFWNRQSRQLRFLSSFRCNGAVKDTLSLINEVLLFGTVDLSSHGEDKKEIRDNTEKNNWNLSLINKKCSNKWLMSHARSERLEHYLFKVSYIIQGKRFGHRRMCWTNVDCLFTITRDDLPCGETRLRFSRSGPDWGDQPEPLQSQTRLLHFLPVIQQADRADATILITRPIYVNKHGVVTGHGSARVLDSAAVHTNKPCSICHKQCLLPNMS